MKLRNLLQWARRGAVLTRRPARKGSLSMSVRRREFIGDLEQYLSEQLARPDRNDGRRPARQV